MLIRARILRAPRLPSALIAAFEVFLRKRIQVETFDTYLHTLGYDGVVNSLYFLC